MTSIYSNIVRPELPYLTIYRKSLNTLLRYCFFFQSNKLFKDFNLESSACRQRHSLPPILDPSRLNPPLISEDDRWAVCSGKALNVPLITHIHFSDSSFEFVCACVHTFITMRVCKSSARSTIVTYVNPKVFCSFLHISLFHHILFSSLCSCRLLSSASTLTFAIYLQLSSSEIRGRTYRCTDNHAKSHKKHNFSFSAVRGILQFTQPAHFQSFEVSLVPLPSPS